MRGPRCQKQNYEQQAADVVQLLDISMQSSGGVNQLPLTWKCKGNLGTVPFVPSGAGGSGKKGSFLFGSTYQPGPYEGTWSEQLGAITNG